MSGCTEIRSAIRDQHDQLESGQIDAHLSACLACREYKAEIGAVIAALRGLPAMPLPDSVLEEVWQRTSRAPQRYFAIRAIRLDWRVAAAAAIVTIALLPSLFRPVRTGPTPVEVARARDEARLVLGLAGRAIRDTEKARDQILNDEISRAFRYVPIRRPPRDFDDTRRSRS